MASKCRKFVPNIFNKSKCQNCFAAKDVHSAEALENNKDFSCLQEMEIFETNKENINAEASRKVSKCGYLFVAPDLDFSNPLDKTRRWQRRFFILYDDGEFTYSVDENPETIPQGEVDMNKCVDVYEAENLTGHQYSLAIATSSKVYYIKGNSKEEISRWFDVLVMYPRSIKTTKRRISPHFKSDIMQTTSENSRTNQDSLAFNSFGANKSLSFDKIDIDKLKSTPYATYRGVRSMKHKGDKHYNEGLRKSNSLHDLSSSGAEISRGNLLSSKFLSRSGDQLDYISLGEIFMHSSNGAKKDWNLDTTKTDSTKMENIVSFLGARSSTPSKLRTNINTLGHRSRRGSFDEKRATRNTQPKSSANRSSSLHRERSSDMMEFSPRLSFPNSDSNIDIDGPQSRKGPQKNDLHSNSREEMLYTSRNNETDELKMAKSSEQNAAAKQKEMKQERKIEDLMYMKKGWLIKQGSSERDWKKHWFVLDAKSLRYFKDAKAEEENILDGRIDLSTCYEIAEVNVPKNYGFCVKTRNGEFILTAMTSGIRNNWMKAIKLCIDMQKGILKKTLSSVNGETLIRNEKSSVDSSTRTRYASGKAFDSELRKKEVAKNIRRHHSDVNPGNVDKALKIREISSGSLETLDIVDGDVTQGLNQRIVGSRNSQTLFTNSLSSNDLSKKSDQWPHQNGHHSPLGRYVEGSDNTSSEQKLSSWNKDEKKHEAIHRTKSPSARVKEKTRSKLPKLLSPPPNAGNGSGFGLQGRDQYQHDIGLGTSEQNTSQDHDQHFADVHGDLNSSSSISRNDGMLVDLLETEAWNLKCQLKDAQEIIRRHKMEVDNLKSKLDMLASKLTGTEKALSEALWDMKQEKELHAKMSTEWSKRTKAAEAQLKEITQKLDKSRASLQAKERECKKLENEVKINMQKIRDSEREILKLRAIEHEYKQTKELLDNNYREKDIMCKTMKEKDLRCRKLEEHIKEMKREFEHDIQSMKDRLCQVQSGMHGSLPSDVSSLLHEKEEIINQLEEKLIESDKKIEDVTDELQAEIGKGSSLQVQLDKAMKENSLLKSRFQDLEKTFNEIQRKLEIGEKENMVLKKQVQDHKEEENKLLTKLEIERGSNSDLLEENSDLQSTVNYLNEHLKQLNDNLNSHHADVDYLISESLQKEEKLYRKKLSELGSNLINSKLCVGKVNDLLQQIMEAQKQDYNQVLTLAITSAADLETCLSSAQHILSGLSPICTAVESDDSDTEKNADMHEIINAQELLDQAMLDTKKLHEELTDVRNNYDKLELDDQRVRKRVRQLEEDYNNQLRVMSQRIDKLTDKLETSERNLHEQKKPDRDSNLTNVSAEIENQLEELENRIESVEKVLEVQDVDGSLIGRHSENGDLSDSSDDLTQSTESSDDDLDSDSSDLEISGNLISLSNNAELISKLKDMKTQLECTNSKLRDFTQDLYRKPPSSQVASPDACLQIKLQRCGEKIENLASRLTKEVFSDNLLGLKGKNVDKIKLSFYACMNQLEEKLYEVNEEVRTIESVGTKLQVNKMIPKIKDKLSYMIRYVRQVESMTEDDWHILGQLYQQRMAIEVKLKQQNSDGCDSDNNTNVQLVLFAEKLALEVAVLGELSYLLQNNYLTNRCSDDLWKEINEVNQLFLQLREKLIKDLDESPLNDDAELLTFYVKMLTEKIIVEGHLISKLGIKKKLFTKEDQSTDSNTDLASLAAEVISRTLTHEYMDHQFLCLGDHLEKFSGHILTQSLLQGELTYALQTLKGKIKQQMESDQDFIKSETHNAYIKLKNQEQLCNELVKKYQSKKIQQIQEIVKESSGKQNVVLVVSQVYRLLETHIKQYEQLLDPSLPTFLKCQIIHSALRKEQDTFMKTIQTALQNTDGTETSAGKDFVDNLKSHLVELADVLVLNATISGQVAYISNLYKDTLHNPESQLENSESIQMMSLSDDDRKLESLTHKLGEILLDEANQKRHFAYQLIKDAQQSCSEGTDVEKIKDMLKCMQSSGKFPYRLTDFSNLVVREAVFRAEMCYLIKKINLELEEEITEFKANHSLDQSGGFQSQEGKRSTADVRDLLSICEDVIKTKYEDEREVLDVLKKEVDCLGRLSLNKNCANCTGANLQIGKLEQAFRKELSVAQERHGVHLDVMRKELNSASGKISEFFDSQNKERDNLVGDYESRVGQLQDELDCIRDEREEELEQVKQDIMTAVSAIRTSEHQTECQLMEQVKQLSRQITTQKNAFDLILEEIKPVLFGDDKDYILKKIKDFQQTNQGTQFEVGDKFLDQTDSLLTDDSTDSNTILQEEISKEVQEDKENEKAEKTLEISQHEQELELLIKEKEEALEEEARSTKAALDAMRKAYEDNLDQEKNRFREALKTMYTSDYVNEIRRHHELEVDKLQEELKSLNLHYTSKCEDYKMMEERLENSKEEQKYHIKELVASNEQLSKLLNEEIEQLKELVTKRCPKGLPAGSTSLEEDLYEAQLMIRIKDSEIQKLKTQVKMGNANLQTITEDNKQVMTQFLHCKKLYTAVQEELTRLKSKLDKAIGETKIEQPGVQRRQPVRKAPSFHHRTRSPSPQRCYLSQKKDEHISREVYKGRRYLATRDIRRSKSSPSLPFVFGSKQLLGDKGLLGKDCTASSW